MADLGTERVDATRVGRLAASGVGRTVGQITNPGYAADVHYPFMCPRTP